MAHSDGDDLSAHADQGISVQVLKEIVDGMDESDEMWAESQWVVADRLHDRYLENRNRADLMEALDRGRQSMAALESGGGAPAWLLADLALIIFDAARHNAGGDVNECVILLERAIEDAEGPADAALFGARLARVLMSDTPITTGERMRAVSLWEVAAECDELEPEMRAMSLTDISAALSTSDADADQLSRAVAYGRRAVAEDVDDGEVAADARVQLSYALDQLYDVNPHGELLEEAISLSREALTLLGADNPDHPGYVADLVNLIRKHGRVCADPELLEQGWRLIHEDALAVMGEDHPDLHLVLHAAAAIAAELGWWNDDEDLVREALRMYRRAANLPDVDPQAKAVGLIGMASTLRDAADHFADGELLGQGIDGGNEALKLCNEPGLTRAAALSATSNLLRDRFTATGEYDELQTAIRYARESLDQTPIDDSLYAVRQTNLGVVLSDRYTVRATLDDLDEAIGLYREALARDEPDVRRIAERENNLALALRDRFATSYDNGDFAEALSMAEQSVIRTPETSRAWPGYVTNFGNALIESFEINSDTADLDRAIDLFELALDRVTGRSPDESGFATNLGLALASRAEVTSSIHVYTESIARLQHSVDVLPHHHPDSASRLANITEVYLQRARLNERQERPERAISDVREAITLARQAVGAAGEHDARLLPALANLAGAMRELRNLDRNAVDSAEIAAIQRRAAHLSQVSAIDKFPQTVLWARDAAATGGDGTEEVMAAYRQAVELSSHVAWIGLSVSSRQTLLDQMSEALIDAVAFAVQTQHYWEALAWADRVRAVLWRQTTHVKSVVASGAGRHAQGYLHDLFSVNAQDSDRERRRRAAREVFADSGLPVWEPKMYEGLRFPGTLVLLVPGPQQSMALLLDGHGAATTVALPLANEEALNKQVDLLRDALLLLDSQDRSSVAAADTTVRHRVFDCLEWIWEAITQPILNTLPQAETPLRRIWWSTLGGFALLPIHAAGQYPRKRTQFARHHLGQYACLADSVMSAYLPTIAEFSCGPTPSGDPELPRLLYVSTDAGTQTLDHAEAELDAVRGILRDVAVTHLSGADATIEAVDNALPGHPFLHVAAHGSASAEAFASGVRLADGVLTVGHLADLQVARGELAVFLTCDSARGSAALPNEALHVAGAAMQIGYPNVIATSIPLRDSSAVTIATAIYTAVVGAREGEVGEAVARAMHDALAAIRDEPTCATDPLQWAPLAYFGWGCNEVTMP